MNKTIIKINPEVYSLEVVKAAAYMMMDEADIFIDKKDKIIVEIRKKDGNMEELEKKFNENLIVYANYEIQNAKNKEFRNMILSRILKTNRK